MWLLPLFSPVARAAATVYYRVRFAGEQVPSTGPVLLVANHPNSLLDPTLVVAAAHRPVRFLAKAPLFTTPSIGWLVRAAGAIPVYRRADDPTQVNRNEDTFRAVHAALGEGAAVGIFPEGISHSEPSIVPLKTGAARIALGAFAQTARTFPVIPVGLVFREKDVFRSEALVYRGQSIPWDDLAQRGIDDPEAVREFTDRIAEALRAVTLNLEKWEDRPLVECAVRLWEAERRLAASPAERVARLEVTTSILADVRRTGDPAGTRLAQDIETHRRRLQRLRLRPSDVTADVTLSRGITWAARRLHLLLPVGFALATIGYVLFWLPYRLTGIIVDRLHLKEDVRSTWKLLVGIVVYLLWVIALGVVAGVQWGALAFILVLVGVPVMGSLGLSVRERWRHAWTDARRFFLLRSRGSLVDALRERQADLARRVEELLTRRIAGAPEFMSERVQLTTVDSQQ